MQQQTSCNGKSHLPAIVNDEQTRSDAPFPQRLEPLPDACPFNSMDQRQHPPAQARHDPGRRSQACSSPFAETWL